VRAEALQNLEPPSWALERVREYGVAGLFPGSDKDFPFVLYTQSVPRPAWSGRRDFHQEKLHQAYEFLITSCAGIQEPEAIRNTVDTFDPTGGFPLCETTVFVDAL
jgi:hypothetical protein